MNKLIKKIQNTAHQHDLWKKGSRIVIGVSGGPDSVCLLDILAQLRPKCDMKLIIAHINYGLRGKDSQRDEEFVRKLAERYNLKIFSIKPIIRIKNSENEMRNIRYEFFERVRAKNKFDYIAVGHNMEDQVETFIMRIIRGSGLKGLSAMQYKSGKIIRPLLGTPRAEILRYLKNKNLNYRIDKTNKENYFFRNRVRNKLIPYLERNFNPNIKKTIFEATGSIAEDNSLIQELSDKVYGNEAALSVRKILKLPPALQGRVLLRFINNKIIDGKNVEATHVSEILKAIKSTKGKNQIVLFKGLKMTRKGDKVIIEKLTH